MARPAKQDVITCINYTWIIFQRPTGIWYADGRGNGCGLKRYSLGSADRKQALDTLRTLDTRMAVRLGKLPPATLSTADLLPLQDGIDMYMTNAKRPAVLGGVRPATVKRYRAIFDKFGQFARDKGVDHWQQVTRSVLESYGRWLEDNGYAYATEFIELSTVNQAIRFLALTKKRLPAEMYQPLGMRKSSDVTRFCYTAEQIEAMLALCFGDKALHWLAHVIVALATTGLRIAELAGLRWTDVDLLNNILVLPDNSRRGNRQQRQSARTTKGGYSRSLPIHPNLLVVLQGIPHHADGRVFHGPEGGILKPDTVRLCLVREAINPLKEKFPSASDEEGFASGRLHSIRHYFCSMSADAGVPEQMLMRWLGHKESRMVRHYYHVRERASQEQMIKLNLVGSAAALLRPVGSPNPETPTSDASIKP